MNVYKISCYSDHGSYFGSYLQSITVVSDSKENALIAAKKWMKKTGNSFIYPETRTVVSFGKERVKTWNVDVLAENIAPGSIIDTNENSDY